MLKATVEILHQWKIVINVCEKDDNEEERLVAFPVIVTHNPNLRNRDGNNCKESKLHLQESTYKHYNVATLVNVASKAELPRSSVSCLKKKNPLQGQTCLFCFSLPACYDFVPGYTFCLKTSCHLSGLTTPYGTLDDLRLILLTIDITWPLSANKLQFVLIGVENADTCSPLLYGFNTNIHCKYHH